MRKIIAIGGGEIRPPKQDGTGHYPAETTAIDKEIIRLTSKPHPTLLFIPTASNDSQSYYQAVNKHFTSIGCSQVDVLYLSDKSLSQQQIETTILGHDAIYVGGGNTLRMMNTWRKHGVDKLLRKALDAGVVLSGLSAGSICWFSAGNSDSRKFSSGSNKLIKVTGLGFINALHCPHYDAEPHRQADLKRMMKSYAKVAIALDNCAALEVVGNTFRIITSTTTAKARKIYWKRGQFYVYEIDISDSYRNLSEITAK